MFNGLEMVIYSSFNSSPEHRRWRVVVPFSRPVTAKEYNSVAKDILEISAAKGFEFAQKKKNANDIMYLPGIGAHPEASFFWHFRGEGRGMLDVDLWFGRDPIVKTPTVGTSSFVYETGNSQISSVAVGDQVAANQNSLSVRGGEEVA